MARHKKTSHTKKYEAGIFILEIIIKDVLTIENNDKKYSPSMFHKLDSYYGLSSHTEMLKLFENIGILINDGRGYVFNNKLKFKRKDGISKSDFDTNIARKIRYLVNSAETFIFEEGMGINFTAINDTKHLIENMDFISSTKIKKVLGGIHCHYNVLGLEESILAKLLFFSTLEAPCTIKAKINGSVLLFNDVIINNIVWDEKIVIETSAIPLIISKFSDIEDIFNYTDNHQLEIDIEDIKKSYQDNEELKILFDKI